MLLASKTLVQVEMQKAHEYFQVIYSCAFCFVFGKGVDVHVDRVMNGYPADCQIN